MTDVVIREVRPGDGAACAALWRDAGEFFAGINPHTFRVPSNEGLAEWFEQGHATYGGRRDMLTLLAEVDGIVVGSISATLLEPIETAERQVQSDFSRQRLHIDSLDVLTAHRRGGVGTALMKAAEAWGRSHGAEVIILETELNNPLSMAFYEKRMGMTPEVVTLRREIDRSELNGGDA
ncbi:GCN5-related N-acetyltransferase [Catenulispora acidiphila DSM 44928]|uniref:GCN5-related N-acetyltransferase n=1 Tax=Catenulispora acidiphila (strain DSM 44928 / JCM 14897 / NBRC 102108 / NRRL B-24433 / ID139908) TaxID=479433 RepID=C7PYA8_CATAD|nr:GNAT family N-acetyltransferase [Catenulispora acidiphila]ACU75398.1 GCN5-related N-acetyltransferase [Catenulispora acidiphila DSM 44928]